MITRWANAPYPGRVYEPTPNADKLASEMTAENPDARNSCIQCGTEYPIHREDGTDSLRCPCCGFVTSELCAADCMRQRAADRAAKDKAEAEAELAR